jgi:hypothetical protein
MIDAVATQLLRHNKEGLGAPGPTAARAHLSLQACMWLVHQPLLTGYSKLAHFSRASCCLLSRTSSSTYKSPPCPVSQHTDRASRQLSRPTHCTRFLQLSQAALLKRSTSSPHCPLLQATLETPDYVTRLIILFGAFFAVVGGPIAYQTFDPSYQVSTDLQRAAAPAAAARCSMRCQALHTWQRRWLPMRMVPPCEQWLAVAAALHR